LTKIYVKKQHETNKSIANKKHTINNKKGINFTLEICDKCSGMFQCKK
jgi:hypothetical protein